MWWLLKLVYDLGEDLHDIWWHFYDWFLFLNYRRASVQIFLWFSIQHNREFFHEDIGIEVSVATTIATSFFKNHALLIIIICRAKALPSSVLVVNNHWRFHYNRLVHVLTSYSKFGKLLAKLSCILASHRHPLSLTLAWPLDSRIDLKTLVIHALGHDFLFSLYESQIEDIPSKLAGVVRVCILVNEGS